MPVGLLEQSTGRSQSQGNGHDIREPLLPTDQAAEQQPEQVNWLDMKLYKVGQDGASCSLNESSALYQQRWPVPMLAKLLHSSC